MRGIKRHSKQAQMMGVGVDIVDIRRFRKTFERRGKQFARRIFLPSERKYCSAKPLPWTHYAGRFAAKEAVAKAFGTGIGGKMGWGDIEIKPSVKFAPIVHLSVRARSFARKRGVKNVLLSISHTHTHTVAVAMLVS